MHASESSLRLYQFSIDETLKRPWPIKQSNSRMQPEVVVVSSPDSTKERHQLPPKQNTRPIRGGRSRYVFEGFMVPDRNMLVTQPSPRSWPLWRQEERGRGRRRRRRLPLALIQNRYSLSYRSCYLLPYLDTPTIAPSKDMHHPNNSTIYHVVLLSHPFD